MLNVGLTGGIGAGKSEVTRRFEALGAIIVDADALAREVVAAGTAGLDRVVAEFGRDMLAADGSLDREKLAAVVFADDAARQRLNGIVHPLIAERVADLMADVRAAEAGGAPRIVVNDVPLIAEAGVASRYGVVIVVDAPTEVQLERLTTLRGMTEEAARARMAAQASREERLAIADYVIVNDGDLDALGRRVEELWDALTRAAARHSGN